MCGELGHGRGVRRGGRVCVCVCLCVRVRACISMVQCQPSFSSLIAQPRTIASARRCARASVPASPPSTANAVAKGGRGAPQHQSDDESLLLPLPLLLLPLPLPLSLSLPLLLLPLLLLPLLLLPDELDDEEPSLLLLGLTMTTAACAAACAAATAAGSGCPGV